MTSVPHAAPAGSVTGARPSAGRRVGTWSAVAGVVLSTVFLGAFSRVVGGVDLAGFTESLYPALLEATGTPASELSPEAAYESTRTLGAWFGFTLVGVLLLSTLGFVLGHRFPNRRFAALAFGAAGLVCLLGTQLILFPVAFPFFLAAGLHALRPSSPGSSHVG